MRRKYWILTLLFLMAVTLSCVALALSITTDSLPDAMLHYPYSAKIAYEGSGEVSFSLYHKSDGSTGFPKGLKLAANGTVYGKPKQEGYFQFSVALTQNENDVVKTIRLHVKPLDKSKLKQGGENSDFSGSATASVTGNANAINGNEITLNAGEILYADKKGFLHHADFADPSPKKLFPNTFFKGLTSNEKANYYYHRYRKVEPTPAPNPTPIQAQAQAITHVVKPKGEVVRILVHPVGGKRSQLVLLRKRDAQNFMVDENFLVFLEGKKTFNLMLVSLEHPKLTQKNIFFEGKPLSPERFVLNDGMLYILAKDHKLYRCYVDGEVASKISDEKVKNFCLAKQNEESVICFTNSKNQLFTLSLDGEQKNELKQLYATALNASDEKLYFSNPKKKNKLFSLDLNDESSLKELSTFGVSQIYVFEETVIAKKARSTQFYIINEDDVKNPTRINKK